MELENNTFDVIGDIHGCYDEFMMLLKKLGYKKGEKTGHILENGIPERLNWSLQYKGKAFVVYGHTVTEKPIVVNRTVAIDQGCVYGGFLTALRYPEMEFIQVKGKPYAEYKGQSNATFV